MIDEKKALIDYTAKDYEMERAENQDKLQNVKFVYDVYNDQVEREDKYKYAQFQADLSFQQEMKTLDAKEKFLK